MCCAPVCQCGSKQNCGNPIATTQTGADVLALAAELELAAGKLRQRGGTIAPEPTGKPN
jgi:hypothetical protein